MPDKKNKIDQLEASIIKLDEGQQSLRKIVHDNKIILTKVETVIEQNQESVKQLERHNKVEEKRLKRLEDTDLKNKSFAKGILWLVGGLAGLITITYTVILIITQLSKLNLIK